MPTGIMLSMFLSLSSSWSTSTKKDARTQGFMLPIFRDRAAPTMHRQAAAQVRHRRCPVRKHLYLPVPPLLALVDAPDGLLGSEPPALPPGPDAPGGFGESEGSAGSFGSFGSFGSTGSGPFGSFGSFGSCGSFGSSPGKIGIGMIIRPLALVLFSKARRTGSFASPVSSTTTPVSEPSSSVMLAEPSATVHSTFAHFTLETSVVAPVSSNVISVLTGNCSFPSMMLASQLSASG